MAEFRLSSDDDVDLRKLAMALVESQGWPRDRVKVWDRRDGEVVVTVDDALLRPPRPNPWNSPVYTPRGIHQACELLRQHDPSLSGVDFTVFRKEATRFFAAGWSVADLQYALTTRPDGMPWPRGEGYQGTEWLEHRLRRWKTPSGSIRPSISQEKAQLRVVSRAGLPPNLGIPADEPRPTTVARPRWRARRSTTPGVSYRRIPALLGIHWCTETAPTRACLAVTVEVDAAPLLTGVSPVPDVVANSGARSSAWPQPRV